MRPRTDIGSSTSLTGGASVLRRTWPGAIAIVVVTVFGGCVQSNTPGYGDLGLLGSPVAVSPAAYHGIAWLEADGLALALPAEPRDDTIVLTNLEGRVTGSVPLGEREPECVIRTVMAVTALPTGELGFAEVCDRNSPRRTADLAAYDPETGHRRSLGATTERPKVMTWAIDMSSAVYTAEGSLCATLYEHDGRDGPLQVEVTVQGSRIPLGEELAKADDRCTQVGNADYPAYSPDGQTLALMGAAAAGRRGQARIDQPWALLVVKDAASQTVVDDIRYPGGLDWLADEHLVFTGQIGDVLGLWVVRRDGSDLTLVSTGEIRPIAVSPDRMKVAGLITTWPSNSVDIDTLPADVVWFDLSDFLSR